jgi:hypothetical protein
VIGAVGRLGGCARRGGCFSRFEVVAVAYDDRRADEKEQACGDQDFCSAAGASPLVQEETPECGKDDDRGHVEGPGGEVVLAHLGLAHGIEEELEVPDDAGECGEEIVRDEGFGRDAVVGGGIERIEVDEGVAGRVSGAHGVEARLACELLHGAVFEDEDGGPDEVGEESSPENDDEDGEILPEVEAIVGEKLSFGECADGFAGVEAEGEEAAHDAGEDGDGEAFAEVVIGFSCFGFFFWSDFVFFGDAGCSVNGYARDADEDAEEDDLAGGLVEDGAEFVVVDRRDDGAEGGAEAEGDGVTEGDAEIADGEAKGETACSPEDAPEERVIDAAVVLRVGGVEDGRDVRHKDICEDDWRYDPRGEALNEPVDLPRPTLDAAEGDEVGGGGKASNPVEDDAKKRVWSHESSFG